MWGHVAHVQGADPVGDLGEAREIDGARIGGRAGDDQFGTMLERNRLDLVVVDQLGRRIDAVGNHVVEAARKVHRVPVSEVAAVGQRESHQGVAGFKDRHVDGHVWGRTRMRLNVHVIAAEELQGALAGQALDGVHVLAAAVVAPARIPFGVLVGKHRAQGLDHRPRSIVFGGDQLQPVDLTMLLRPQSGVDLGIDCCKPRVGKGRGGGFQGVIRPFWQIRPMLLPLPSSRRDR